jgi:hypothetical protein
MCCGSRRLALRPPPPPRTHRPAPSAATLAPSTQPPPAATSPGGLTALHYQQAAPIRVIGPTTGRVYAFSGSHPVQMVDIRDALVLGRSALFRPHARDAEREALPEFRNRGRL